MGRVETGLGLRDGQRMRTDWRTGAAKTMGMAKRGGTAWGIDTLGLASLVCLRRTLLSLLLLVSLALHPAPAAAMIHAHPDTSTATGVVRSLETLRDLDYRSWQLVAYREGPVGGPLRLRVVGYPGRVRLDHPTPLLVTGGRRLWELADLTLASPKLVNDAQDAAAEFDLQPLLADLRNNRPLRLELPGVFTELPVPPYVVAEWRQVPDWREGDAPS